MPEDTNIGGRGGRFPTTRRSAVLGVGSADDDERLRSLDTLIAAYWKPVYKYIRIRWRKSNEDAKDLTQGFFLRVMEKDYLAPYDPARGRFRTFLRTCLDGYLANEHKAEGRLKRGGGVAHLSLDFETAEGELSQIDVPDPSSTDRYFEQEWVRSLLGLAVTALREECAGRGRDVDLRQVGDYPDLGGTKYRLAGHLGRGGMGSVYLVEDTELGREAALEAIVSIMIGSTFKGLLTGAIAGYFATRWHSLPKGIAVGLAAGLLLSFLVAAMPGDPEGNHYYLEIMLPGTVLGGIVGFATQRYGRPPARASRETVQTATMEKEGQS